MRYPLLYYVIAIPIVALMSLIFLSPLVISLAGTSSSTSNNWKLYRVQADANTPGTVAVLLTDRCCDENTNTGIIYETRDYGVSWELLSDKTSQWSFQEETSREFYFANGDLRYQNQWIWTYPRYMFRTFFWGWGNVDNSSFLDIEAGVHTADTTYVALGRDGLLIGPYPTDSDARSWTLVSEPFPQLNPRPLTIRNPLHLLLITALGLLIPPLPFIHAWLLAQVWRYAVPGHDMEEALRPAWRVSLQLTIIAAVAVILWLTNINTRFYAIVGGMAIVVVVVGLINAWEIAQKANMGRAFTIKLLAGTALVSLIVPAGVATTQFGFGWTVIITLITGFMSYRHTLEDEIQINSHQGEIDHLSLEVLGGMLCTMALLSGVVPLQLGVVVVVTAYIAGRLTWIAIHTHDDTTKKTKNESSFSYLALLLNGNWWGMGFFMTIGWFFASGAVSTLIFFTQLAAWGYFYQVGMGNL